MGLCLRSQNRNATRGTPRSPPAPKSAWRRWKLVLRRLRTPLQNLLRHKGFGLWMLFMLNVTRFLRAQLFSAAISTQPVAAIATSGNVPSQRLLNLQCGVKALNAFPHWHIRYAGRFCADYCKLRPRSQSLSMKR